MINNGISPDEMSGLLGKKREEDKTLPNSSLSKFEMEALTEILNVSFGSSSTVLANLFSREVSIMAPELTIKNKDEMLEDVCYPSIFVLGQYLGTISGKQFLIINKENVKSFVQMMDASSDAESTEKQLQVVQEVIEKMFAAVSYSMSAILDLEFSHLLSGMDMIKSRQEGFNVESFTNENWFVHATFHLIVGSNENIFLTLCIPVGAARQMVEVLSDPLDDANKGEEFQTMNHSNSANEEKNLGVDPKIQSVQFSNFDESPSQYSEPNNLNMLLDVPLQVTVELGRTKRMVKEILEVSPGSIIELDKLAGEPVDILVNKKLIAVGEVVVIDDNFGVRVTDILSTADRIPKLR